MAIKVQFNPSTLKAIYNPATKKVQTYNTNPVGNDCEFCNSGETPKYISVIISDIVTNTTCTAPGAGQSWRWEDMSGFTGTYAIEQDAGSPCFWYKQDIPISVGCKRFWYSNDCTGEQYPPYCPEYLVISVQRYEANVVVSLCVYKMIGDCSTDISLSKSCTSFSDCVTVPITSASGGYITSLNLQIIEGK